MGNNKSQNQEALTFRPIAAGPNCGTSRLSNYIDIILKPFLQKIKSYVRDDLDFLNKIPKRLAEYKSLVTLDDSNMHTNIGSDIGLYAIKYWLQQHPNLITRDLPNELIIEALSITLKYNTLTSNSKDYIQIRVTAMGTKVAPTYVTLVMGYLENNLYETIEDRYGTTAKNTFIKNWKRYLNDCFII